MVNPILSMRKRCRYESLPMGISPSNEQLAMDDKEIATSGLSFGRRKGVFIKLRTVTFLTIGAVLLLVGAIVITYYSAKCADTSESTEPSIRSAPIMNVHLPSHIVPSLYEVKLFPNITGDFKFSGQVVIALTCVQTANNVTLHQDDLTIDLQSVKLKDIATRNDVPIVQQTFDKARHFYIIETGEPLLAGSTYTLAINYSGSLGDKLSGFYLSNYEEKGEARTMGVTQFQATDARKAFPCFDEPKFKAMFKISLARPNSNGWNSLSNMQIETTENHEIDGWVWDHFKQSVKMSTYLVAFAVAQFEPIKATFDNGKKEMGFWSRPSAKSQLTLAQSLAPKILDFYQDYFQIPFPLEKCDMIAVPDFSAGAMENWGLVVYREGTMLYDETVSMAFNNQRVAIVIAHELAHQWFGNLVTPVWWIDLWLNEGFASFMEYIGVDHVRPNWKMDEQFVLEELYDVLEIDALSTSHPISQPVYIPDQITEIFDRISYGKGAAIIRMMYLFLGEEGFKKGISAYLNDYQYANAEQVDLWGYLTKHSAKPLPTSVKDIMNLWTLQMGYPVVTVKRNYPSNSFSVSQSRFVYNASLLSDQTQDYRWWIYLTWKGHDGVTGDMWMSPNTKEYTVTENVTAGVDWMVFNVGQYGYFRVNYDEQNWKLLRDQLMTDHTAIDPINRAQILDDSLELAKAGLLDYKIALGLTSYLKNESSYVPIGSVIKKLNYLSLMLSRKEAFGKFQIYMGDLLKPLYDTLNQELLSTNDYEAIDITQVYRASSIFTSACKFEASQDCITTSIRIFNEWKSRYDPNNPDQSGVPVNMKQAVYCTAIQKGKLEDWDFLWAHQIRSNLASEKKIVLSSLACTEEVWVLSRFLEWILDSSKIRKQDASGVFQLVAMNKVGRYLAFDFMRDNWGRLVEYFGGGMTSMDRFVSSVSDGFNTQFEINQLKAFEKENAHLLGSATRATKQAIENAETNHKWMVKNYRVVNEWLTDYLAQASRN